MNDQGSRRTDSATRPTGASPTAVSGEAPGAGSAEPAPVPTAVQEVTPAASAVRSRRGRERANRLLLPLAVGLLAAAGWEVFTRMAGTFATPPLTDILAALVGLPFEPDFWPAIATTMQALLMGYAIAVVVGVPLGVLIGRARAAERLASVYVAMVLSVPLSAVVPIVIILFGIGLRARVSVVVLFALPMVLANAMTGVSNVPRNLLEMSAAYGCRGLRLARKIIIPAALPEIFAGLRLGAGRAVIGMVVAELIIIAAGVGKLIDRYSASYQMASMYAVVIVILMISAVFVQIVRVWERHALSWRDEQT